MDKKNNHEEMDKMPTPQKKEDITFADFVNKNKDIIYKIAKANTVVNEAGLTVIPKDDPWRDEKEWDEMYEDLKKK
ncbi:hypothetical protein [Desulfosporosinus sp. BICA1-9]|uniref:hypothetical protein n=1 Tax=Desulfosporosinus sp. BICA1-9 TaxID=1531958 RepID=UPI00054C2BDC|nr:hypothetical protein [Desulfosporosinus sp. BICA1-9]KJS46444.1 MAG: hypothetical protein VR66_25555 [Peptococcaceae bacterium BRH_c23]KJS86379.1 MAG: hypothetical protein JL57_16710 [Desulfosporosinus sp. BICA1-9]HBW35633.1 hypothetical protein [Desulfosporosinus sp.]